MNITYRKYTSADEKQILPLIDGLWDYVIDLDAEKWIHRKPGYAKHTLKKILTKVQENEGIFLVAQNNNRIIGFIVATLTRFSDEDRLGIAVDSQGIITELYIEESHRNSGVGRKLISLVEDYFISKHCGRISVGIFAPNIKARNFYKKCGFVERNINMMKNIDQPEIGHEAEENTSRDV